MDWTPLLLSFKLAFITTMVLLCIGVPLAYFLAFSKSKSKFFLEALIGLPIVLPPTVLGFYLLLAFSPQQMFGSWVSNTIGVSLVFSFVGLVVASVIYSLPFMIQPVKNGFESTNTSMVALAKVLGKSNWTIFWKVILPNNINALVTGAILTFAHTLGEFGVVLMIGGSIPKETKVASIAIFEYVETLQFEQAHRYAIILLAISFIILLSVQFLSLTKKQQSYD